MTFAIVPPKSAGSVWPIFPDLAGDGSKDVFLQAGGRFYNGVGGRHVAIWWINGYTANNVPVTQLLQLVRTTGDQGLFQFYHPMAKSRLEASLFPNGATPPTNEQIHLGKFSYAQRQVIIQLAKNIPYVPSSRVNDCGVWMRDLVTAMSEAGLIGSSLVTYTIQTIPLPARQAEV